MKNNIIYKRIVCIVLMVMLLVFTTRTYAANDSFKTTLSADNSSKKRGENVTITIGIKDIAIESGEKGIGAYTAKVDFDTSIFEYVSASGTDKWETPLYQSGLITGMTVDGEVTSEAQSIGSLKFKVKDNAQLGKTTIKLTKFSGSTAETDVDAQDTSISITITDENGNTSNDDNGNNQNGENGNGDNQKDPDNSKDQNDSNNPNGENESQNGENNNGSENGKENGSNQNEESAKNSSKGKNVIENLKEGLLPKTGTSRVVTFIVLALAALIIIRLIIMRILLNSKKTNTRKNNMNANAKRKKAKSRGRRAK